MRDNGFVQCVNSVTFAHWFEVLLQTLIITHNNKQ